MDSEPTIDSNKRTLGFMQAKELAYKLKRKQDFLDYLDK